jgi:two-component system cell cycle response regulator
VADPDDTTASLNPQAILRMSGDEPIVTLVVVAGGLPLGKMFQVPPGVTVIGRSSESDVWLDDEGVSRQHARLVREGTQVSISDAQSRNGTFCNGDRIHESTPLNDGDKVQVGSTVLKFTLQDRLDEAMQQNLFESATRDGLTAIHNRRFFEDSLEKEFAHCQRQRLALSVALLDLDHFKLINDTHGHPAGDHVLREFSRVVSGLVRIEDIFARIGGEEFALLLRECPADKALVICERIRQSVARLDISFSGARVPLTVSAGLASLAPALVDHAAFIKLADEALYSAKSHGRNRVEQAQQTAHQRPPTARLSELVEEARRTGEGWSLKAQCPFLVLVTPTLGDSDPEPSEGPTQTERPPRPPVGRPRPADALLFPVVQGRYGSRQARLTLGRSAVCDIVVPFSDMSKVHAYLAESAPGVWTIEDAGSLNGTVAGGQRVRAGSPKLLEDGATVTFGEVTGTFMFADRLSAEVRRAATAAPRAAASG